jgi:epoxyqueuosine reductase
MAMNDAIAAADRLPDMPALAAQIRSWGAELGFQQVGFADIDLGHAEPRLREWLSAGFHGDMDYMAKHGAKRSRPAALVPGTVCVISARMNYLPQQAADSWKVIGAADRAFVSRYAVGRDYHKVVRNRLKRLADRIEQETGGFSYRVFTDSAPVLEVELAQKASLGWRGKHTLLLSRDAGSYFFLGEIYTDLPLPPDRAGANHCGSCTRCIDICPTRAIVGPYRLDARRCISYLTIEHHGSIPLELRPLIGNRIYGCDDCQLVCPWNKYAQMTAEPDFAARNGLDDAALTELFEWTEEEFRQRLSGSAIYRIGYERWLRNLAVAMGNALARLGEGPAANEIIVSLRRRATHRSPLVREHVAWAIACARWAD